MKPNEITINNVGTVSFQDKRLQLCNKIQEERSACINLRVQIRLEQDRIQRKTTLHQIRAN